MSVMTFFIPFITLGLPMVIMMSSNVILIRFLSSYKQRRAQLLSASPVSSVVTTIVSQGSDILDESRPTSVITGFTTERSANSRSSRSNTAVPSQMPTQTQFLQSLQISEEPLRKQNQASEYDETNRFRAKRAGQHGDSSRNVTTIGIVLVLSSLFIILTTPQLVVAVWFRWVYRASNSISGEDLWVRAEVCKM